MNPTEVHAEPVEAGAFSVSEGDAAGDRLLIGEIMADGPGDGARLDDLALALRLLESLEAAALEETLPRLRLCASLWKTLHYAPCLEAALPRLAEATPAAWALACLSATVRAEDPDAWLETDGAPLLEWALDGFLADSLPAVLRGVAQRCPVARPLALAYALRRVGAAWPEVIDRHGALLAAQPDAAILLVGCVDSTQPLLSALLEAGHADLSARAFAANIPAPDAAGVARNLRLAPAQQVSLSRALAALGFARHAAAVAHAEPAPSGAIHPRDHAGGLAGALAERVNTALLAAERGQRAEAGRALSAALADARALTGALSAALADLLRESDPASAETAAREAIQIAPARRDYTVQLAAIQADAGRTDEALRTLAPALAGHRNAGAHLLAARAHLALGDAHVASEHARRALALPVDGAQALEASRLLARAGDLKEAVAAARRAVELTAWDAAAWANLAELHRAGGDIESASAAYAQAAALAPNAPHVRAALAECLAQSNRLDAAERQFSAAGALAPGDARVAVGMARLALAGNAPERAAQIAREGLEHDPENGALYDALGAALEALGETEAACRHYEQATRLAPALARPWLSLAAHHRAARRYAQARATLEAAADAVPMNAASTRVLTALADVYIAGGEHERARDALARALALAPGDDRLLVRYGSVLRALNQPREALAVLQAAADGADEACRTEAAYEMALAYDMLDEPASALSAAQIAAAGRPDEALYQATLGRVALKAGRADIAVDALNAAIATTDADPDLYNLLGRAYHALNDPRRAMEAHTLALRMQPDTLDYQFDFALAARDAGQHEAAVIALREVVAVRPDHAQAQLALGLSLEAVKCWQDAYHALTAATVSLPDDPAPHQALGRVCMHLRNPECAIAALNAALKLDPDDVASYHLLGEAYSALGRVDEAVRAFHQALERCPDDAAQHAAIGAALVDLGAHAEAIPVLQRARALAPKDARLCSTLSRAYSALGDADAALEAARAAVEIAPESAPYHVALGELLAESDAPNAAVAWTIALQLNPNDAATRQRLIDLCERLDRPGMALEVAAPFLADPGVDKALLERATRWALAAGDVGRAGHLIGLAVACDGRDPALHALAGEVSLAAGEPLRALAALRYAAELNPREPAYRVRIAALLLEQNRPGEALDEAQQAFTLGVDNIDDLLALGQLFNRMQRWSSALPLLMKVIERRRDDATAWLEMGQARVALAERALQLAEAGVARERLRERELRATLRVVEQAMALGATGPVVTMLHGQALSLLGDHAQAITLLDEAHRAAPNSLTRLALGEAHLRAGDLTAAERYLFPTADQAHLEPRRLIALGTLYRQREEAQAAYTAFKQAASAAPGNPVAYFWLAQAAVTLERRASAIEALTQAINLVPNVPAWHHQLGEVFMAMGHTQEAIIQLEQATALQPENPEYAVSLGRARRAAGDAAGAIARYEEALHVEPGRSADWWAELGGLYESLETGVGVQRAAQCYKRALKLDEAHAPALLGLARLALEDDQIDEALAYAQRAAQAAPERADAQAMLAACTARTGDVEQAAWLYERAAGLSPSPAPALLALGRLYSDAGEWPKAIDALRRSVDTTPDDAVQRAEALVALARAYEQLGDLEAAAEAAQDAAGTDPGHAAYWGYLGRLHRLWGRYEQALDALTQASAVDPADATVHHEMGLVYEEQGQYRQALDAYLAAIRQSPDWADSYFRAGMVFKRMKDYHNAIHMLQQARRLDPDNAEAHRQFAAVSALAFVSNTSPVEVAEPQP